MHALRARARGRYVPGVATPVLPPWDHGRALPERQGPSWTRTVRSRCSEYNSRLILHCDAPVFTTVVYLVPGSDTGAQDAFRLFLGDRLANEGRFDVVRLW
jgi:hypothetical protein